MVLDLQVFVEKLGWPRIVRSDSADLRGRDEDIFGLLLRIKIFHRRSVQQIQLSARFADKPLEPLALQFPPDGTADQTAMASHVYSRVLRHWHGDSLGWILRTFQGCPGACPPRTDDTFAIFGAGMPDEPAIESEPALG